MRRMWGVVFFVGLGIEFWFLDRGFCVYSLFVFSIFLFVVWLGWILFLSFI